jgi:hypothetical protein
MHATLKAETASPPAGTLPAQQARFDHFRATYNQERPHEALGQETPASLYQPNPRRYPQRLQEPHYHPEQAVRRVRSNGEVKWGGDLIFVSEALTGEPVAINETESGDWIIHFADHPIGLIHRATRKLRPYTPTRPGQPRAGREQTPKSVNDVPGL